MLMFDNILQAIGNTPLVKINRLPQKRSAAIYAKVEFFNPGGSVKDRIALSMIKSAERHGVLKEGGTFIEATSGNTGIGLAMVAAARGYKAVFTMPSTMSVERQKILKAFGAELILIDPKEGPGMTGAIKKAKELSKKNDWFHIQQFGNFANPHIHHEATAPEIIDEFKKMKKKLHAFVAGIGTGGTISGCGLRLKDWNKNITTYGIEPKGSPVLSGGKAGAHKIEGIGAGFKPLILDIDLVDKVIKVKDEDAIETARRLAKEEGILCGVSSGAAMWAALKVAKKLGPRKNVVVMLPDTGERYLSGDLFRV